VLEPFDSGFLQVSPLHRVYYEQSGNPDRRAGALFLHGGPGSGTSPNGRRFFDPAHYRIVLVDQRGAGRSTPCAELEHNTTWDLVADLELLRVHLDIERWLVFGGSWGSTLALAYAQTHPERVSAPGAARDLPAAALGARVARTSPARTACSRCSGASTVGAIPEVERGDLISAYHRRLTGADEAARVAAARAWARWEARLSFMYENASYVSSFDEDAQALAFARIESHYFVNGGLLRVRGPAAAGRREAPQIPAVIVHGQYDVVCPVQSAYDLHRVWPEAVLRVCPTPGTRRSSRGSRMS
jgi:proline iminopeptidase